MAVRLMLAGAMGFLGHVQVIAACAASLIFATSAVFVSLLASASMHRLEPFAYMRDLLCLLPSWPRHRVLELAPAYWRQTLEKGETQQTLDAHVLRRVVLGLPGGAAHRPQSLQQTSAAVCDG
jgi:hypothetical protein